MRPDGKNLLRVVLILVFVAAGISALVILPDRLRPVAARNDRAAELPDRGPARQVADANQAKIHEAVDALIQQGAVRVDSYQRRAWIAPAVWIGANAQTKELTARALAVYVSPQNPMVTIFDAQSGRELASYGPFQGFAVK